MAYDERFSKEEIEKKIDIWFSYRANDNLRFKSERSIDSFLITVNKDNELLKHEIKEEIDDWLSYITSDDYEFGFKSSSDSFLVTAYRFNRFPKMED